VPANLSKLLDRRLHEHDGGEAYEKGGTSPRFGHGKP